MIRMIYVCVCVWCMYMMYMYMCVCMHVLIQTGGGQKMIVGVPLYYSHLQAKFQ